MPPWMIEVAEHPVDDAHLESFHSALERRDASTLPAEVPTWAFLNWLTEHGFVLHGSNRSDLSTFEPRPPNDRSPDEFSKQIAVFASSDGIWALMYALVDRSRVRGMLNSAVQVAGEDGWSTMRYYLSLAPAGDDAGDGAGAAVGDRNGSALLRPGVVYALPAAGFRRMTAYEWPGLGVVLEPHWACRRSVEAALHVPVVPADLPIPVRVHDAQQVAVRAAIDPWGFPWAD